MTTTIQKLPAQRIKSLSEVYTYNHNPTTSLLGEDTGDRACFSGPVIKELLPQEIQDQLWPQPKESSFEPAVGFLGEAQDQMEARAKLRDTPGGERTAKKIAEVFNAITGHGITEEDAWTFLIVLKMVRARAGKYNRDDFVDLAAYSSLMGESASKRKGQ